MTRAAQWLFKTWLAAIPAPPVKSVVEWARTSVKLVGSARSETFDPDITPWTSEPIECANHPGRMTFVGPVQSGKSAAGEIALCKWLSTENGGDLQYNWQNDEAADSRWSKRIEKILKACRPVMARVSKDRFKWKKGLVIFPHCNLTVQGVYTDRNVASDSIRFQINEEIHDEQGWLPGRLQQAWNRTAAFWNAVVFNISNAGKQGGQLHQAFEAGTMEHWQDLCPGCGRRHVMRTRWDDKRPDLGGLRYDSDACRTDKGEVNYQKLLPTIRFQMPCGYSVRDELTERRPLSLGGKYSEPTNTGATPNDRSFILEAVSVYYIPWIELIKEKHRALRALKYGDPKPWWDYLRERECQFISPDDRPIIQRIVLSDRKASREGLSNRIARVGALDYQHGKLLAGETPHWWGLIQDLAIEKRICDEALAKAVSLPVGMEVELVHILTVFEGKLLTDHEAAEIMKSYEVVPTCVCVDSGYNAPHVYEFCLRHGFNAIKGSGDRWFAGPQGERRTYSTTRLDGVEYDNPLWRMANSGPTTHPVTEPQFWLYSSSALMDRLAWLRSSPLVNYEVPADTSEDFIAHMDAWSLESKTVPKTGETVQQWTQHGARDDLFKCACYTAMLFDMFQLLMPMPIIETATEGSK